MMFCTGAVFRVSFMLSRTAHGALFGRGPARRTRGFAGIERVMMPGLSREHNRPHNGILSQKHFHLESAAFFKALLKALSQFHALQPN